MATKSDFTEQEWEQIQRGATGAGLLVSLSDRSFFDSFKEAGALAKHLVAARKNSDSELIRELAETRGTGFGIRSSPDEVERETLAALESAMTTLESKAPEDAVAYRAFVLDVAESVGNAAGGGEDAERGAIEKIRSTLGETTGP
jgi:hypothetical protein